MEKLTTEDAKTNADPETLKEIVELKKELETIKLKDKEERKESTEKVEKEVAVIKLSTIFIQSILVDIVTGVFSFDSH